MAVPKKKHSKQRSRTLHSAWQNIQRNKLFNAINIVSCSSCGARIPERTICSECGMYKNIQMVTKKTPRDVTVIKA